MQEERGSLGRGKGRKRKGGDKSRSWSSQDLVSTDCNVVIHWEFNIMLVGKLRQKQ